MDKGFEKFNAGKPTECDSCGGQMIYIGTGEYECRNCKKIMLDDYGKVRQYIDSYGESSIMILERETGVSRDVLDYLVKEGILVVPKEKNTGRRCAKCGNPIERGRYCRACKTELANGLAGAFSDAKEKKTQDQKPKDGTAKMHLARRFQR